MSYEGKRRLNSEWQADSKTKGSQPMQNQSFKSISVSLFVLCLGAATNRAAVYQESGGQVVIEAEHFDSRTTNIDSHHWHIAPLEDVPGEIATAYTNVRGSAYIQALPNSGANHNTADTAVTDPFANYRVFIQTTGTYQLYLRWGATTGDDDSMYGCIAQLKDGVGGTVADWYRYAEGSGSPGDFSRQPWRGTAGFELLDAGGNNVAATWVIAKPGLYTIQLTHREDGCAVDALILQLSSMAVPSSAAPNFGPPESQIATNYPVSVSSRTPAANATGVNPVRPIRVQISDGASTQVDPNSIDITLICNPLTLSRSKLGDVTTVTAAPPAPPAQLPAGSLNTIAVNFNDLVGGSYTDSWTYTVANYPTLPPEFAVTGVDTSAVGFSARIHQIRRPRSPGDLNTIAMAERQLADGFIDPSTSAPYTNMIFPGTTGPAPTDPDGIHYVLDVINWNEFGTASTCNSVTSTNDAGDFQVSFGYPNDVQDTEIPGLYGCIDVSGPDTPGYNDNMVVEVTTYLNIPQGYYTFGVNSDDGFKVSVARGLGDGRGLTFGSFNGGRGSADTLFDVYVPTSGIYPVRLLWWEGGGGANCEFFYLDPTTFKKTLINDSPAVIHWGNTCPCTGASLIKAYRGTASATVKRPYVSRVTPEAGKPEPANTGNGPQSGQLFVFADADVAAWITDGTITVNPSSVSLIVNGTTYTGATKSGSVTTVSRPGSLASLLPGGSNYAAVVYSYTDGGSTVTSTNSWMFTVVPYTVVPAANAVPSSSLTLADTA